MPKPSSTRRWRFHACGPGWSISNTRSRDGELRPALGEGVEARAEDDVLVDAALPACSATRSSMKRARATMEARNGRVPSGCMSAALAPALVRRRQLQADLVLEHVRRRIDLDVQRPPQGDAHRRAVG